MQIMCVIVTIGTTIQTAAANYGMFVAGRFLAGFAVGYVIPLQAPLKFELMNSIEEWSAQSQSTSVRSPPQEIADSSAVSLVSV